MEVIYQLEREDYWQNHQANFERVPGWKWKTYLLPLVLPGYVMYALWIFHVGAFGWQLLIGAATYGLFIALISWARKRVYMKTIEGNPGALGLNTLALGLEGIRQQSPVLEAGVKWPKVTEIAESPHLIVLFLGPRNGFFVPKRAFPNAEGAQAFLETARAYRSSSLNGTMLRLPEIQPSWPPAPERLNR